MSLLVTSVKIIYRGASEFLPSAENVLAPSVHTQRSSQRFQIKKKSRGRNPSCGSLFCLKIKKKKTNKIKTKKRSKK